MSKRKSLLYFLVAVVICSQAIGPNTAGSGIVDTCKSTATVNSGVVLVCPLGDGDPMTSPVGGGNCQITLTIRDNTNTPIPNIPAVDMWLVGCNDGLLLCGGGSSGSAADGPTNAAGTTTFSNEPVSGGCDTGVYVVYEGIVLQDPANCLPKCFPVAMRSPDYKSAGAPGPAPCAGDIRCPDSKVSNADFSWFSGHYSFTGHPGSYIACADYAAPLGGGSLTLADFSKFTVHFAGAGHKCPI